MFDDIVKKPAHGIMGYCVDCRNGHFLTAGGQQVMCQVKGVIVDRKYSCQLWASRGLNKVKSKIKT